MRVLAAALAVMAIVLACGSDDGTPDITVMLQFPDGGRVPVTMTPSEKFNDQVIGVVPLPPSTSASEGAEVEWTSDQPLKRLEGKTHDGKLHLSGKRHRLGERSGSDCVDGEIEVEGGSASSECDSVTTFSGTVAGTGCVSAGSGGNGWMDIHAGYGNSSDGTHSVKLYFRASSPTESMTAVDGNSTHNMTCATITAAKKLEGKYTYRCRTSETYTHKNTKKVFGNYMACVWGTWSKKCYNRCGSQASMPSPPSPDGWPSAARTIKSYADEFKSDSWWGDMKDGDGYTKKRCSKAKLWEAIDDALGC